MKCTPSLKIPAFAATLALFLGGFFSSLRGASGTISPPGANINAVIAGMNSGDVLTLEDGTYNGGILISGKTGITIKARNIRKALINNTAAVAPIKLYNCSNVTLDGIYVKDKDTAGASYNANLHVYGGGSNRLLNLLVTNNNRYNNSHLLLIENSSGNTVQDFEGYWTHRSGIIIVSGNNNTITRAYVNARFYADISGGYPSGGIDATTGDQNFIVYPGSGNVFNSCISENAYTGFGCQAHYGNNVGNQFVNCISINDRYAFPLNSYSTSEVSQQTKFLNILAYRAKYVGMQSRSAVDTSVENATFLDCLNGLLANRFGTTPIAGSFIGKNLWVKGNGGGVGVKMAQELTSWSIDGVNSYGNSPNYDPSSSPNYKNQTSLNDVIFFVSTFSSVGVVSGVNSSDSLTDVLSRLPAGIGAGSGTPPPAPTGVDVSQQTQPPSTSQPSGPSTSQVAIPFLIAGVIGAALILGSD